VHLIGGCRAINNPGPLVDLTPNTLDAKCARFELKSYGTIYWQLKSYGLGIIGVDFYSHALEVQGLIPPDWRAYHRQKQKSWPSFEAIQIWGTIRNAAFQNKNGILWDLASRIAYQLYACTWRLRETSEAYSNQLNALVRQSEFEVGAQFMDGFTILVYLALQAFLVDACILRDYLAEFVASFVLSSRYSKLPKITTMAGLKKHLLNMADALADPLLEQLKRYTDENGWIRRMGSYRDLIIHSAPLVQAKQKLFAICDAIDIEDGRKLPSILCPIPENPSEIQASRAKGTHFEDFTAQFEAFAGVGNTKLDGLQYVHQALGDLSKLALELAKHSPITPKMMHFDRMNIIGQVVIKKT
jgi:hypothetical protein